MEQVGRVSAKVGGIVENFPRLYGWRRNNRANVEKERRKERSESVAIIKLADGARNGAEIFITRLRIIFERLVFDRNFFFFSKNVSSS